MLEALISLGIVILFSVPLAAVGVMPTLAATGSALSVVVFIGLIVLAGMVVNNAIVLVDRINQLRESTELSVDECIVDAENALEIAACGATTLGTTYEECIVEVCALRLPRRPRLGLQPRRTCCGRRRILLRLPRAARERRIRSPASTTNA